MKHVSYFDKFVTNEVDLNKTRIDNLNDRVEAVSKFLKKNLDSFKKIERQGSYALRTVIRPVREGQDYDADLLLYMEYDESKKPHEYIDEVYECFKGNGGQRQLFWPLCASYFGRSGSGVIVVCNCRSCACRPCASLVR